jgi:hypothetical protein
MINEKYFAEVERELLSRFRITFEDTGYERFDWIEKFDCEDAEQDVAIFGEKYGLTEIEDLLFTSQYRSFQKSHPTNHRR